MNTVNPKVSIIVPVYNTQEYLPACLESLVNQTLEQIEIILVDDGSTDCSGEIISEYARNFPTKIKALYKENGGQASARNLGIHHSKGKYIGFVDSDDIVSVDMYKNMYESAEKNGSDLVECDYTYCKTLGKEEIPLRKYGVVKKRNKIPEYFIDPLVSPWNKLYRKSVIEKAQVHFPEGLIYEDTVFYINLLPWIKETSFLEQSYVTHYARCDSTQTKKGNSKVGDMLTIIEMIAQYYQVHHFWEAYKDEVEYFCVKILLCSSLGRMSSLGDKHFRKKNLQRINKIIKGYFPDYRKNPYFKSGWQNLYIRNCNRWTMPLFSYLIGKVYISRMNLKEIV